MKNNSKKYIIWIFLAILIVVAIVVLCSIKLTSKVQEKKDILSYSVGKLKYNVYSFEPNDYNYEDDKTYSYDDDNTYCHFAVHKYTNYNDYDDIEKYMKDNISANLNDEASEYETVTINNNEWGYINVKSKRYTSTETYYYTIIKGKDIYNVEYEIYDYNNGDSATTPKCVSLHEKIINSLSFE